MEIKILKRVYLPTAKKLKNKTRAESQLNAVLYSPSDKTYEVGEVYKSRMEFYAKYGYIEIV